MLTDQSLPKYRDIKSLLNELHIIVVDLESRSGKANKLLFENKLTEPQKLAYDKLTKELAVFKNSLKIMEKLSINYDILCKISPSDPKWIDAYNEYLSSNNL
jgi:hypothetical protein